MKFKQFANPILFLSDAPDQHTGLARIARDLATLTATSHRFRVGYLGRGSIGDRRMPWTSYSYPADTGGWGEEYVANVWRNFSDGEDGIIFSNWDLSRLGWFLRPEHMREDIAAFLGPQRTFAKWIYTPVDSVGPNNTTLPVEMAHAAMGADRLIVPSEWAAGVVGRHRPDVEWLPHGIFTDTFHPIPQAKQTLGIPASSIMIGCVMANQARKDWPAAMECAAALMQKYGSERFGMWCHTDMELGGHSYWNLLALAADYGVGGCVKITTNLTDHQLALHYSACDCTILPSACEGFGYPIAESMACGTAAVVTNYAAGQELVEEGCRVDPVAYRVDTQHNVKRAVLSGYGFAAKVEQQVELKKGDEEYRGEQLVELVRHLDWRKLKHQWLRWLHQGLVGGGVTAA